MNDRRGVSPVIGTILMVAIVVLLAGGAWAVISQLGGPQPTAPQASFDEERSESYPAVRITHEGGETLSTDSLDVRGGVVLSAFPPTVGSGASVVVLPTDSPVRLVWTARDGTSYVLFESSLDSDALTPSYAIDSSGSVSVSSGSTVEGSVRSTGGSVGVQQSARVLGDVVAADSVDGGGNNTVYGDVRGDSGVEVDYSSTVYGDVVSSGGSVDVETGVRVYGDVEASGSVSLDDNTVVEGDVDASSLSCGSNVTVVGTDCGDYDV